MTMRKITVPVTEAVWGHYVFLVPEGVSREEFEEYMFDFDIECIQTFDSEITEIHYEDSEGWDD